MISISLSIILAALVAIASVVGSAPVRASEVPAAAALSPTLEGVRRRGELIVGIKVDYPPFGMLGPDGQPQGMEVDMARELARRLGVRVRLVPVTGANRLQRLEEGSIDLVLATMGDTAERRRLAVAVEPNYYASGVTLMTRPETRLLDWQEVRGQTVCATQGSYFNRPMSQRYLLNLLTFNNARDARLALRDGRCIGYMFDNTAIWADLQRPEWAGYKATLPPAMPAPWAIALRRAEEGGALERWIGDVLGEWHRSGWLRQLEQSWGLPPSVFLAETHELWMRRDSDGQALCRRDAKGQWPAACRNRALLTAQDVSGIHNLGLELRDLTGWNLTYLYDEFDRARFLRGLGATLVLMVLCASASLALGVLGALVAESRLRLLGGLARALAVWGRMTPPLLQMYLLFFGIGAIAWAAYGVSVSAWFVAVWCLAYYTGASVMTALLDASALRRESEPGFRLRWRSLSTVYGHAAGSITSSLVNVSKATMMASVIAVPELMSAATSIVVDQGNVKEVMNMLLLVFLVLVAIAVRLLGRLEARLRRLAGSAS
jgi:polar amino acid transport system substrate-binding protein